MPKSPPSSSVSSSQERVVLTLWTAKLAQEALEQAEYRFSGLAKQEYYKARVECQEAIQQAIRAASKPTSVSRWLCGKCEGAKVPLHSPRCPLRSSK